MSVSDVGVFTVFDCFSLFYADFSMVLPQKVSKKRQKTAEIGHFQLFLVFLTT